jgi:hypothetical protein
METKQYECITFDVEKNIKKPDKIDLFGIKIKKMLSNIFIRAKP